MSDALVCDALVIGGGPAGSAAAILLARAGWRVVLVERDCFPRRKVCGECLSAAAMTMLDRLGIGEAVRRRAGAELRRVAFMAGERIVVADMPRLRSSQTMFGRAIGRDTLDALLLHAARDAGVSVLQPWIVRSISGEAGRVSALAQCRVTRAARTVRARTVIAAHGAPRSTRSGFEARADALAMRRRDDDLIAFKANYVGAVAAPDILPVIALDGGYGGMVVADQERFTLACCIRRDVLRDARRARPDASAGEAVEALLRTRCRGVRDALHGATRIGAWLSTGPIRPGMHAASADPLAIPLGNAAGEPHPLVGEGINMALQSAWLACERLACLPLGERDAAAWQAGIAVAREEYLRRWRAAFAARVRRSALLAAVAMHPAAAALAATMLARMPVGLGLAARLAGKAGPAAVNDAHPTIASAKGVSA